MDEALPNQSEQLHTPEEKASPEVKRAIAEIKATESSIAAHTGLEGQELTDSTDDFLTDKAEHAANMHASDTPEIVETALIEGALEEIGERPESEHNPIVKLEKEGYDKQVTDGVQKLHEEHVTLPDGESAAEVVAQKVAAIEGLTADQSEHYDSDSKEAGWDSPERAQKLVEAYITPDSKVLDIGIGTGQAVNGYAEKGATVIGLDHDESMLTAAESIVGENGSLRQADINKDLPIFDLQESVDVAQAVGVLEFAEDLPKVLEQVHGSLKENGVFVFTSEIVDDKHPSKSEYENVGLTVHRHSKEEIQDLLEKTGYTLLKSEAYAGYEREDGEVPYGIFLAQKQVEKLTSKPEIESYKGNWFNLQQQRMSSPDFREKFGRFIEKHKSSLNAGEPSSILQKPESFQSYYQSQLYEFDDNLSRIGGSVGYGIANEVGGKSAGSLGHGKIGRTGTVYRDAIHQDGTPLTDEQKDIIAAHEAYHGMINAQGSAVAEIKSGFDWNAYNELVDTKDVKQPSYLRNPDELTARMAQFKNYFGMQGGEQFTPDHLNHLRQHYIEDTGLDNGVATMLKMVTPATEKQFIELMNKLPI